MALPKIATNKYRKKLPSIPDPIEYRAMVAKEEQMLLMAMESEDYEQILDSMIEVARSCILTEDFSVDSLLKIDLELLFLNIRSKSVSEKIELVYQCENETCGEKNVLSFNVEDIIAEDFDPTTNVQLNDEYQLIVKCPSITDMKRVGAAKLRQQDIEKTTKAMLEVSMKLMASSLVGLVHNDSYTDLRDLPINEKVDWIGDLDGATVRKIEQAASRSKELVHAETSKCTACGHEKEFVFNDLQDFFQ